MAEIMATNGDFFCRFVRVVKEGENLDYHHALSEVSKGGVLCQSQE